MDKAAYLQMAETEQSHWWFAGRRAILEKVIAHHLLGRSPRRVLEIGAGTGGNLTMLSRFGTLAATEMDEDARRIARIRSGIDVLPGHLPDGLPAFPEKFDLICLLDVLEHVDDDLESLRAIRALLAAQGLFVLTVPAHPWLWGRHDEVLHHKRRYTRTRLESMIAGTGLQVLQLCYFNTLLFAPAVLGRALDHIRLGQSSSGTEVPPPLVNSILTRIFSLEANLLPRCDLPFGVSLLAVLRHP